MEIPQIVIDKLNTAKHIVIFTGAGISAESGIKTFRDPDGLWAKFSPEELASMDGFMRNPQLVWEWYAMRLDLINEVHPNPGHIASAEMEKYFDKVTVVTQNVDRLHQRAGSTKVLELHGNLIENYCSRCERPYVKEIGKTEDKSVPKCEHCGAYIRPAVVWFGESLPMETLYEAGKEAEAADVMFVIGTSGAVYPAAHLPIQARRAGTFVVEINPNETELTPYMDVSIHAPSGVAMPAILEKYLAQRKDI